MRVLHKCDTPSCVNPEHLFIGTLSDNSRDRDRKRRGRNTSGTGNSAAKLTEDDVRAIRSDPRPYLAIAKHFGVYQDTVGRIKRREHWSHVP
jgi:DNA invertase Pin-like site-specific DNA recombinase